MVLLMIPVPLFVIYQDQYLSYVSGMFSLITSTFHLRRRMIYYLLQCYIPTIMLVCLSWIIFFMHPNDVADRLAIGITILLTMVFFIGYINSSLPALSYVKAVDEYLFSSLLLICLTVLEGIIVYALYKKHKRTLDNNSNNVRILLFFSCNCCFLWRSREWK